MYGLLIHPSIGRPTGESMERKIQAFVTKREREERVERTMERTDDARSTFI